MRRWSVLDHRERVARTESTPKTRPRRDVVIAEQATREHQFHARCRTRLSRTTARCTARSNRLRTHLAATRSTQTCQVRAHAHPVIESPDTSPDAERASQTDKQLDLNSNHPFTQPPHFRSDQSVVRIGAVLTEGWPPQSAGRAICVGCKSPGSTVGHRDLPCRAAAVPVLFPPPAGTAMCGESSKGDCTTACKEAGVPARHTPEPHSDGEADRSMVQGLWGRQAYGQCKQQQLPRQQRQR